MLTDNQNKLIEDIKLEFSKMNTAPTTGSGGLINRADIERKVNESNKRRAELQLITDATNKAMEEMISSDMERLNKDLIPMGMIAKLHPNNNFIVRIDDIDRFEMSNDIYFRYIMSHEYEAFSDRSGLTYYTGFGRIEYLGWAFDSIDDLCKNDKFIRYIEDKYKDIVNKKCK